MCLSVGRQKHVTMEQAGNLLRNLKCAVSDVSHRLSVCVGRYHRFYDTTLDVHYLGHIVSCEGTAF